MRMKFASHGFFLLKHIPLKFVFKCLKVLLVLSCFDSTLKLPRQYLKRMFHFKPFGLFGKVYQLETETDILVKRLCITKVFRTLIGAE